MNVSAGLFWTLYGLSFLNLITIGIGIFFRKYFIREIREFLARRKGNMAYMRLINNTGELCYENLVSTKDEIPKIEGYGRFIVNPSSRVMVRGLPEYTFLEGNEKPFDYFGRGDSKSVGSQVIDNYMMKAITALSTAQLMKWLKIVAILGTITALLVMFIIAMILTGKGGEAGAMVTQAIKI